eukprot:gnl/MRDRNA2_/MRDRNA2_18541_c0_seq1.p1 gnl/MRDRNA2_/MRDRNA2_18541_c0~~gnl/MRDRNA2_/MRDRNA2_18541_c0_seq1.p1  ORF type:complete len:364 (+),score=29.92 gnl/MRDRNA2_/MRDRNA2_18541_c0_seq1:136-1092(+)
MVHTVMGPEHLSTIITFSAFQGRKAFWLGIRWGIGHMGGMVSIAVILLLLKSGTRFERYEQFMDYTIGIFLMGFGFFFLYNAHLYFDAEWNPTCKGCACHKLAQEPDESSALIEEQYIGCEQCESDTDTQIHPNAHDNEIHNPHCLCKNINWQLGRRRKQKELPMHRATIGILGSALRWDELRDWGACISGFIQGLACPAGLVGVAFIKSFKVVDMVTFATVFFVTATMSMGVLAMTYGLLTQRVSSKSLARGIYYSSACLSLFLGIAWIYLNAAGSLDQFFGHEQLGSPSSSSSALSQGHDTWKHPGQWRAWLSLLL